MATHANQPRPCRHCAKRAKRRAGPCPYHAGRTKTPTGGGTRSKPARPTQALPTEGPRQTARMLLGQLEALQAKLAERIAAVRELSEIL